MVVSLHLNLISRCVLLSYSEFPKSQEFQFYYSTSYGFSFKHFQTLWNFLCFAINNYNSHSNGGFQFFFSKKKNLDWYFLDYISRKIEKKLINIYSNKGYMQVIFIFLRWFFTICCEGERQGELCQSNSTNNCGN